MRLWLIAVGLLLLSFSGCVPYVPGQVDPPPITPVDPNSPPVIIRPRVTPDDPVLIPREPYLFDFNLYECAPYGANTGVYDVDGDSWRIVYAELRCEDRRYGETLYCAPYEPGVYHAEYRGHVIENAFLVYPLTAYEAERTTGLPYAPMAMEGYPYDAYVQRNVLYALIFPRYQEAVLTVTVEDERGARATESFTFTVMPLEFKTSSATERESRLIENNVELEDGCWAASQRR